MLPMSLVSVRLTEWYPSVVMVRSHSVSPGERLEQPSADPFTSTVTVLVGGVYPSESDFLDPYWMAERLALILVA